MTTMRMLTRQPITVSPAETESRPALVPRNGDELSVTTRQRQVLQLICDGCRTKEIALQLVPPAENKADSLLPPTYAVQPV